MTETTVCVKCIICSLSSEHATLEALLAGAEHNMAKIPPACVKAWRARLEAIDQEVAVIQAANTKGE